MVADERCYGWRAPAGAVAVGLLFLTLAGCCKTQSKAEQRTEALTGQQRVSRKLAAIHKQLAAAPPAGKTTCPASLASAPYVLTLDDEYLARFSSSGSVAAAAPDLDWDFLRSKALRTFKPESDIGDAELSAIRGYVLAFEQRRYVIVFTDKNRKPARLLRGTEPVQYDGGSFDGMMRVFDSETGKLLCQAPVKAQSSDSVRYFDKGLLATNPQEAMTSDFGSQLTTSTRAVLAEIAPGVHVQIPQ